MSVVTFEAFLQQCLKCVGSAFETLTNNYEKIEKKKVGNIYMYTFTGLVLHAQRCM